MLYGTQVAAHLSGQLLSYTRTRRFHKQPIPLGELLSELTPLLRRSLGDERSLRVEVDEAAAPVNGDPVEIQQVVLNLVTNAAQATGPGGRVCVRVLATDPSDTADPELVPGHRYAGGPTTTLEVSDDGSGIPEAIQEQIFDPFFSTKERGHGLGLAATLGIVHGHGGAIALHSTPGMGSLFRIFLPIAQHAEAVTPDPSGEAGSGRVLIVDDEPYLLRALETALARRGFATLSAGNGEEALSCYRERGSEIDVVLLDFKMPGMSGVETFRALREIDPRVVALLTSGHYKDETGSPEDLGFAGFFQKPYDLNALDDTIRALIRRRA